MIHAIKTKIREAFRFAVCSLLPLVGAGSVWVSCSDFLEIKSREEILLEDFWNEKADVDNIVAGCYSALQTENVISRMIVWGEARSENMNVGPHDPKDGNLENVLKENIKTKNGFTTWDGFYTVINRCNTVIKYAPRVADGDPGYTQSELQATIAEVSALRDLCYFYLIRTFRNVPYSTTAFTDDDQMMALPPTPFEAVLDSLILDLETVQGNAMRRYPAETKPLYQTGRITKSAIWAMLCEMYLWKQDYDNCKRYADLVIQDKKDLQEERRAMGMGTTGFSQQATSTRFNGFPLIDSRNNAFENIFVTGNSQETIFELYFDKNDPGYSMLGNSAVGRFYGSGSDFSALIAPSGLVAEDGPKETNRTIYEDANKKFDARVYWNANGGNTFTSISKYAYRNVSLSENSQNVTGTSAMPYTYAKVNDVEHFRNSSPWIIYRLTDIMLLKAEALCQQMLDANDAEAQAHNAPLLAEAFSLVNAVNKRAVYQTQLKDTLVARNYRTKSLMQELVMRERHRELMYEGKRWYDVVRRCMREGSTDFACTVINRRSGLNSQYVLNTFRSPKIGMWALFLPYNDEETKVNPSLAANQNPAFDSGESNIQK